MGVMADFNFYRFLANKFGIVSDDAVENAVAETITENVRDIKQKYWEARAGKTGDELNEAIKKFLVEELPKWALKLERTVGDNGHAVGNKLTLADLHVFNLVADSLHNNKEEQEAAFAPTPKLRNIAAHVHELVKEWLAVRPETPF